MQHNDEGLCKIWTFPCWKNLVECLAETCTCICRSFYWQYKALTKNQQLNGVVCVICSLCTDDIWMTILCHWEQRNLINPWEMKKITKCKVKYLLVPIFVDRFIFPTHFIHLLMSSQMVWNMLRSCTMNWHLLYRYKTAKKSSSWCSVGFIFLSVGVGL